jgi:FAD/FMN-containing dehydrogenase
MTLHASDLDGLAKALGGTLLCPGDDGYEEARRVHNGLIDKRPAAIARCFGVADVVAAVNFARERSLEISVRGGGHSVAGKAVCDGGLMIDMAGQKGIHVDRAARTARAQAGLTWGEFNRETQLHGLATTGGVVSTTGIAGLTLGGGIGYLIGKHGLAIDNLLSAEIVTADGRVLSASPDENDDLFWALRGGGGNFGVVTSFEYRLHPVGPEVTGGVIEWPFGAAREVLRFYREYTSSLPDELMLLCGLVHAPDGSGAPMAGLIACHCGSLADGKAALAPMRKLGPAAFDQVGPISYEGMNSMLDQGYPKGALSYWKSSFLKELSDEVIDTLVKCFAACPSPMSSLVLEHYHGAATRVAPGDTAFAHRSAGYNFLVVAQWMDPAQNEANIAWARDTYSAMEPHVTSLAYVNYMEGDEADPAGTAFGPNLKRLRAVKDRYDPENLFHVNQNIAPSAAKRA